MQINAQGGFLLNVQLSYNSRFVVGEEYLKGLAHKSQQRASPSRKEAVVSYHLVWGVYGGTHPEPEPRLELGTYGLQDRCATNCAIQAVADTGNRTQPTWFRQVCYQRRFLNHELSPRYTLSAKNTNPPHFSWSTSHFPCVTVAIFHTA